MKLSKIYYWLAWINYGAIGWSMWHVFGGVATTWTWVWIVLNTYFAVSCYHAASEVRGIEQELDKRG